MGMTFSEFREILNKEIDGEYDGLFFRSTSRGAWSAGVTVNGKKYIAKGGDVDKLFDNLDEQLKADGVLAKPKPERKPKAKAKPEVQTEPEPEG